MKTLYKAALLLVALCIVASPAIGAGLSVGDTNLLNDLGASARRVGLGTQLNNALMAPTLSLFHYGNMGHDAGANSDGVLVGQVTDSAVGYGYLFTKAQAVLAVADDGGVNTTETTGANDATGNDVTLVPTAGAENDAYYIGHATKKFERVDITVSTQGNFVGTVVWEYYTGSAWAALSGVTDGTSNFSVTASTVSVTFTVPTDWTVTNVNSISGYWIRGRISAATSGGGAKASRVYAIAVDASGTWTDDTTDLNSAGAGDVALLPTKTVAGDAFYFGSSAKFWGIKLVYSQARVAGTLVWQYWNGTAWTALSPQDTTTAYVAAAGTKMVTWAPPATWAKVTVNSQSAYWVRCVETVEGVSQQPLATRAYIKTLNTGDGFCAWVKGTITKVGMNALTASAANADTKLMILNLTKSTFYTVTWTKADTYVNATCSLAVSVGDELAVVQVGEDGTTEFANANIILYMR